MTKLTLCCATTYNLGKTYYSLLNDVQPHHASSIDHVWVIVQLCGAVTFPFNVFLPNHQRWISCWDNDMGISKQTLHWAVRCWLTWTLTAASVLTHSIFGGCALSRSTHQPRTPSGTNGRDHLRPTDRWWIWSVIGMCNFFQTPLAAAPTPLPPQLPARHFRSPC
jgi:hypothetical protein